MSYKLESIKSQDDLNFDRDCKALLEYIQKNWDVTAEPKGFKEFLKLSDDERPAIVEEESTLLKDFKGHDGCGTVSFTFPTKISKEMTAFEKEDQGRQPLETLIGAILGYGMLLGKQWGMFEGLKEGHNKANHIIFVAGMAMYNKDPVAQKTFIDELNDFRLNPKANWLDMASKWNRVRDEIEDDAFLKDLAVYMKGKKSKIFYDGDDKKMHKIWGHITYRLGSYGQDRKAEFYKKLEATGFTVKQGQKEFTLIRKK